MNAKKPVIEIKDLTTKLGDHIVHKNINLEIYDGEIFAIVGGSGSGKSTLIREILGLQTFEGSIKVLGQNIKDITEEEYRKLCRKWGVLYQGGALFSSLTLYENVSYILREFSHLPSKAIMSLSLLKILLVGLPKSAALKYPAQLSGGMAKRGALARSLILDPKLLFLDEPTTGLDPESVESLDELIEQLRTLMGLTVVMVTHDLRTLWHIADRVAFLGEGQVLCCDTVRKTSQHPHPLIQNYFHGPHSSEEKT